ncbi:MAG: adenylate kinase [Candidatus Dadabacteria bacterium]|nr:adenylate kinase [Candidatus Dadabacteria bacterium]
MIFIIFGPPGVGKGTQAAKISQKYNFLHVSTGDILRASVKEGTELGKLAKSYMDKGELVPDNVIIGIIRERISDKDSKKGFLFDGFPRTIEQAEALDNMLSKEGQKIDSVISIELSDEEIVKRISGRRVCEKCGSMYHIIYDPPTNMGYCNKCGGGLYQRDDDSEDVIRTRLEVYRRQTEPIKKFYKRGGILKRIDGLGTIDDVFSRIEKVLKGIG